MLDTQVSLLRWRLGPHAFATDVRHVVRIESALPVRPVPRPAWGICGVAYYQEHILPVLDLPQILLGERTHTWNDGAVHLVFQVGAHLYAGKVDAVVRIAVVDAEQLAVWSRPPAHPAARFVRAFVRVEGEEFWMLDMERLARQVGIRDESGGVTHGR